VLSGYQGGEDVGAVILDAVELVRSRNPSVVYCCDPVLGDVGRGFYARPGIPEFWRDSVVEKADIMTPNLFELEFLVGRSTSTLAEVVEAAAELRTRGPETVVVTSVVGEGLSDDVVRMLALGDDGAWIVETPLIGRTFTGSGDLTTAMFLAHWLRDKDLGGALGATASIVYSVLEATASAGHRELRLVAAQEDIVAPRHRFEATRLS